MISYPIFRDTKGDFSDMTFVSNAGPNIVDDGLIGWIEFDETDEDTLKYFVHEYTQNNRTWPHGDVLAYQTEYDQIMKHVLECTQEC